MNREGKKCVLYPRVSTEMQVDGYSLEGQKNSLKRFADREEMEIVGIYEDAGKSGKSIEGRPAFKKMLSDIKNGLEIDYILVYKLSRFGRNAADILNSLEFVQSYGINLICIEEGIDSSQTSGKLLISVLSAVAEIERENIIEQTMNGRREKARQGGWNGGFAPYGYYLKDNQLLIEETEAEAIRIIFDKFANSDVGLGGVAKYLNLQGIKKIPRQNGTLETWSSHFIRLILDNPVYCGKIAYGRRTREKVKGTKNEYKQVHTDDYILEDGQHEGIVSEELWQKAHTKRMATGIKQPSKIGKDRSHLLTGILKCPICGSSMYTNKHAWTNKDGTYKEVYYYICGRNKQERGHHCDYKASLRKTDIEPLVIEAVKELVSDKYFAKEIEKRIGVQTDTTAIDKELANYESKLKEVDLNKARLEREIDNLPIDARFRERKIHDMTLRLDGLYDTIVELEERIEDAKLRRSSIEMEAITLDNIYKLMLNFGKLYDIISDEEKKNLITYLIKEIQIYPNGESEMPLKSIEFNFPIYRDGQEVRRLLWEKGNTVETSRYLEIIYPTLGVKFVAIQERVDTETGEGTEMMPFHNIFNEWYAAQTSKKVRAVWAMKAANGKRSNFRVPYGYRRDELDKEKWLVDDAAAEVVRRIYHLCLEGKGPEQIARLLQKEKVLTPTAYYYSIGSSSANRPMPSDPYLWKDSTVDAILSNRKYTGCMVNLKTTTVSYKVHKLIRKPEEEWSIVPNAQEAIIDENTWLRVQELRKNKRRPTATGKTSLFSGLVFCADCGSKLHFCAAKSLKANQEFFRCANYKSGRGECTIHYIRNVVLEQIVSVAVSDLADFVTCHESFFLQMIGKKQSAGKDQNIRSVKSDITAEKHRIDEIDRLIAKLYEDNFAGKLSDERYSRMAAKYEKEQAELLRSVSTKEKELAELERESVDIRLLLAGLREYSSMETLTPEVVNKIIKRIEVHNSEMVNGHKRVRIDIHFTGVGLVDLATIKEMLAIAESSRP